ncbi:uncharacterized protein EI97DRAFT_373729 [Westerdykella ornata]|uniref:Membrane-associated proteins in eicosanoid and glutathione metabolism n=1 Tax=Westerdykella ornata TaxID=318751 RepID=A0A6A6JQZ6_WESOR|nr:uncharacterized protein EI97DRAFT_373729 [Westerdykella ornata]KAF2278318.1 hypothetical protein EI97DRAFT_373729 [Westerdykella ornata]
MTTRVGLGVLIAPATATWAAPFAAYYMFLQNRVHLQRLATKTVRHMGTKSGAPHPGLDPLYVAIRSQGNFAENVPMAFIVALLAELNGADRRVINYGLGALLAARIVHVEFGLRKEQGGGIGRRIGHLGSQAIIAGFVGYTAYLVKDYWMGVY